MGAPFAAAVGAAVGATALQVTETRTLGKVDERSALNCIVRLHANVDEKGVNRLQDCVMVLPGVLSASECTELCEEADALIASGYTRDLFGEELCDRNSHQSLRRVSVEDMSNRHGEISRMLLEGRVLPVLEREFPEVLSALRLEGFRDSEFEWASDEPTVNRYTRGGTFDQHEDAYSLSCIVLLSDDFEGGGTRFWPEAAENGLLSASVGEGKTGSTVLINEGSSVLVQPSVGTALLFNGDITHAGSAVHSGVRHLYVGSFDVVASQNYSRDQRPHTPP